MSIFNIPNIVLDDTFESWFSRSNTLIDAVNTFELLDARADTTKGLYESFRGGGVVMMGISAGAGIDFDPTGRLTLGFGGITSVGTRTRSTDVILTIDPLNGNVIPVTGSNMLPSSILNDMNFEGVVTFTQGVIFGGTNAVVLEVDASFRDKTLELSVNFDDELEFATVAIGATVGMNVFFVDTIADPFPYTNFTPADSGTFIGRGVIGSADIAGGSITVTDFIFSGTGDAFSEFSSIGATAGGQYALLSNTKAVIARGLQTHTATFAPPERQTLPTLASGSGLIVTTRDTVIPDGGGEGQKLWTWVWNANTENAAWTSSENIEIFPNKYLKNRNFRSNIDRFNFVADGNSIFSAFTTADAEATGYANFYSSVTDTLSIGPFGSTSVITPSIQFKRNGTLEFATTGLAINLNADLLDGAHGTTTGGTPNTVPITDSTGKINQTFLPFGAGIEETISQTNHGLSTGMCIRKDSSGNFVAAIATGESTANAVGIVVDIINPNSFKIRYFGIVESPEILDFVLSLGYGTVGGTVALNAGEVYYLSEFVTGGVSNSKPSNASSVTKPMFIALENQKILITNYNGRPAPTGDTIDISSVIPVGSISFVGDGNINLNSDFLVCDGKIYSSVDYPDLKNSIQTQFNIEAFGTSGQDNITVAGEPSETRNFATGQTLQLKYGFNPAGNPVHTTNVTLAWVTGVPGGVRLGLSQPLAGNPNPGTLYDDIQIQGTGQFFVVPDLRSRGVVGTGDPDGAGSEDNLSSGDLVEVSPPPPPAPVTYWNLPNARGPGGAIPTFAEAKAQQLNTNSVTESGIANGLYKVGVGGNDRFSNAYEYLVRFNGGGGDADQVMVFHRGGEFSDPNGGNGSVSAIVRVTNGSLTVTVETNDVDNTSPTFIDWWNGYRIGD